MVSELVSIGDAHYSIRQMRRPVSSFLVTKRLGFSRKMLPLICLRCVTPSNSLSPPTSMVLIGYFRGLPVLGFGMESFCSSVRCLGNLVNSD